MSVLGIWSSRLLARAPLIILSLCVVLIVSVTANVWHYCAARGYHTGAVTVQARDSQVDAEEIQAARRRQAAKAESDKRLDQLYREIERLSELGDHVLTQGAGNGPQSTMVDGRSVSAGAR
jgi:cell shape-determining protein MreC